MKKYSGNGAILLGEKEWQVRYDVAVEQRRGAMEASGTIEGIADPGEAFELIVASEAKMRLADGRVVDVGLLQDRHVIGDGRLKVVVNSRID